ncbi:TauD/TfdA family dioxygenase [Allokutzneria sp. A3M-2-11 16]|uniref:TauD/TfdA family dioxygenase n=1 Tax=Allokutzneria sp. A3M-2-11 16 TaxID=2962043 RepID=UPI0020B63896|nr:TauD/TfdA family dioxygenase [Allokutzneria sp. A3M-2-11 16]MCP3804327.1 TauD/TfdA family dioxygenase [Allokutzneria sp. A3M-2-11 16]
MTTATSSLAVLFEGNGEPITEHIRRERERVREHLTTEGAVLLRGFSVGGVEGFDAAVRELSGEPLTYSERSSPRSRIKGNVYTSTEYPEQEEIFAHNENSYQRVWPQKLFFYCVRPPLTHGATPLASTREVLARIDESVREEFVRRGWMVVRNYSEELGLPWQEVFNTDDRDEVTAHCANSGLAAEWIDADRLRTKAVRQAVHTHPVTGEQVWFNHATFFHISTLPQEIGAALLEMCGEENLPNNTYYGDGGRIPDDVMDHLRSCYRAATTRFDYRQDDVLVIDNMLCTHAREPFTGPRKIAVAMAEPYGG